MNTATFTPSTSYRLIFTPSPLAKGRNAQNFVATFNGTEYEAESEIDLLVFTTHMDGEKVYIDPSFVSEVPVTMNGFWTITPFQYN